MKTIVFSILLATIHPAFAGVGPLDPFIFEGAESYGPGTHSEYSYERARIEAISKMRQKAAWKCEKRYRKRSPIQVSETYESKIHRLVIVRAAFACIE